MSFNLQQQIRDNSRELNDFLKDLSEWTGEVKEKDRSLVKKDATIENVSSSRSSAVVSAPPVRGRVEAHRVKSEEDLAADKKNAKMKNKQRSASSSSAVNAPEVAKDTSVTSKDMGNACFKKGDYETAISHYTRSIEQEGGACAAYANRAMCGLKLGRWAEAEADCTEALRLEPTYLKAHQRRGIARRELGKNLESTLDFEQALRLEPNSKILVGERDNSKTAYELHARLRPTQPRRVVKINVAQKKKKIATEDKNDDKMPVKEIVVTPSTSEAYVGDPTAGTKFAPAAMTATKTTAQKTLSPKKMPTINIIAPRTGAEFESMWNRLKIDPGRRMELVRVLSPDAVSSVFKSGVAASIFTGIVRLCLEGYAANTLSTGVAILSALTNVPRFDMAVMFVTGKEKKELQILWDQAAAALLERVAGSEEDIESLRNKYRM